MLRTALECLQMHYLGGLCLQQYLQTGISYLSVAIVIGKHLRKVATQGHTSVNSQITVTQSNANSYRRVYRVLTIQ